MYRNFCDLLGLPRDAVHLSLDGEQLDERATPKSLDLETGDLIEAKVDFSKQSAAAMKTFVRLKLVVNGRRTEVFKTDVVRCGCRVCADGCCCCANSATLT